MLVAAGRPPAQIVRSDKVKPTLGNDCRSTGLCDGERRDYPCERGLAGRQRAACVILRIYCP